MRISLIWPVLNRCLSLCMYGCDHPLDLMSESRILEPGMSKALLCRGALVRVELNHFAEEVLEACLRVLKIIQKFFVVWQDVLFLIEAHQGSSICVLTKRICSELQNVDCHCGCEYVYLVSLISLLLKDFRREIRGCAH